MPRRTYAALLSELSRWRSGSVSNWQVPYWGNPLAAGIFPLCVVAEERVFPIGTAFVISHLGIVCSAMHNVHEALKRERRGNTLLSMLRLPKNYSVRDIGLFVLHHHRLPSGQISLALWPLDKMHAIPPTDIVFATARFQSLFPFLQMPVSFGFPRIGSRVICLGYDSFEFPEEGIDLAEIQNESFDWGSRSDVRLMAVEGEISNIFVEQFAAGFLTGPCFSVNCAVAHGQSGGPVINGDGYVCGVISAGADTFFGYPTTLVSALYPSLVCNIDLRLSGVGFQVDAAQPIFSLVQSGNLRTDGTEALARCEKDGAGWRVDPLIHREDAPFVFPDFRGFSDGRRANPTAPFDD